MLTYVYQFKDLLNKTESLHNQILPAIVWYCGVPLSPVVYNSTTRYVALRWAKGISLKGATPKKVHLRSRAERVAT